MGDVTGDARSEREPWEADREVLSAAGVPRWAHVTGNDDWLRPRLFVWVNDALDFEARLVGEADGPALRTLGERAAEVLRGDNVFGSHCEPTDLGQPVALAVVHEYAVGYGSLGRSDVRPLADVVRFASQQLDHLVVQRGP